MAFPDWDAFTPTKATAKLEAELAEADRGLTTLEALPMADYPSLVWALDDLTRQLWHTWGALHHMLSVANSDEWRKVEENFQQRIVAFSLRVGQSRPIYDAVKRLLRDDSLTPVRKRVLEKMAQAAEHAGVGLDGEKRDRFNAIQTRLSQLSFEFSNAVLDATTPEIADAVYVEAMKHEKDRDKREKLYRKRSTRAPENAKRIDEILNLKRESAALLGYRTCAELSISGKCAPSVDAVFAMIRQLDDATLKAARNEDVELGADHLEPWDMTYEAERLRERKYAYSEEELKRHFEFGDVLRGLFKMTDFLFGVEVREIVGDAKPSVWHKDVRFFEVIEKGNAIAHFYLDPFARPGLKQGGAWMNEFENRDDRRGTKPLAVLVLNLKDPDSDGRCLMPMREVETLFHEFGHALQHMLTRVTEEDAAGINLVEWDAVEVASQFMENWCLDPRTGLAVPSELKAKVRAARNFRAASACRRQLAFAETDMILHGEKSEDAPNAVKNRLFDHYGLPHIQEDNFLCAFTHIFGGGYAAGYYGYKWSEVMSADCYGAFEEAGLDNDDAIREVGRRYRDTILSLGGSEDALSVFRRFRGRNPEITALLRQTGLK